MQTRTITLFLLGFTISQAFTASIPVHIHIQDPTSSADVDIPVSEDDALRIKRSGPGSGSPDFFGIIKRGITGKISQLASASAGASATFSKGSSGGGGGYHYPSPHDTPISYGAKTFDFWTLKKSILNTLLQAVKAINGGIIALKGKLIQGSGAIISTKGRIISMKGEAIANVGKHIIMNAKLSPVTGYHSAPSGPPAIAHPSPSYGPPSNEYGPPSSPSGPSASGPTGGYPDHPPSTYGAPTAPAYGPPIGPSASPLPSQAYLPHKVTAHYDGIVILKKIPKNKNPRGHSNVGLPPSAPSAAALAALPLQDERHKVVKPTVDVTKTLFSPQAPKATPFQPTAPSAPTKHSFFESSIQNVHPPEPIHGSPIESPPSPSTGEESHGPLLPTIPPSSPAGFVDDSNVSNHDPYGFKQQNYDFNKALSAFKNNIYNANSQISDVPPPFDLDSLEGDLPLSNYGLGTLNNAHSTHSTHLDPIKTDLNSFAPGFSNSGTGISNYKFNNPILQPGSYPQFDVVKSIAYELPTFKRH